MQKSSTFGKQSEKEMDLRKHWIRKGQKLLQNQLG